MNIYVGNLPKSTTEAAVRNVFSAYGEVSEVKLIKDQYSGELRGFGFVVMPTQSEAEKAIAEVNGSDLEGRTLTVNEAKPRTERSNSRPRSGGGFGGGNRSRSW
jgi:RNA recognition motif-containing protein